MPVQATRRASPLRHWTAGTLATGSLFLSSWIYLQAPNYFLLRLGVGAPEISAWLIFVALGAIALAWPRAGARPLTLAISAVGAAAALLAATPLLRFPATASRFDQLMAAGLGGDPLALVTPARRAAMRPHPLSALDLFRGIPAGDARVTRAIPVASPGNVPLTVDVYQPAAQGSYPIVVQIYGGAWQRGEPGSNGAFAAWLAARGYVVFAIDYRHAPATRWPALLEDVRLDLAWIAQHAATYGGDTAHVALLGRSAGAHLALLAAYEPGPLPVSAVVSFYGPVDLTDAYAHPPHPDPLRIRELEEALIGGSPTEFPDRYRDASPSTHVKPGLPPTLMLFGSRDHIVEPRYGVRLHSALVAAGNTAVYLEIPWAEHAFDEVFNGPSAQLAIYHTERFLAWAMARPRTELR